MNKSSISRLGAVVAGLLLLSPLVASCAKPAPPKISASFIGLQIPPPDGGVIAGESADFTYRASGVPSGGSIFLQKAAISGATIRWSNVSRLNVRPLATATIIRPTFGVDTYRVGIFDSHGHGLASALLTLDVYQQFLLSDLTTRPVQMLNYLQGGQGGTPKEFDWLFQSEIDIQNTSCRFIEPLEIFNSGFRPGQFEFDQTVAGKTTKAVATIAGNNFEANGPQKVLGDALTTLHSDLDLRIIDAVPSDLAIYGSDTAAFCLTDTGSF